MKPNRQRETTTWIQRYRIRMLIATLGTAIIIPLLILLAARFLPFDDSRIRNLDVSTVITDRNGQFLRAYLCRDQRWRMPANIDSISHWITKATIAAEDKRFYEHGGIDLLAVGRAIISNMKAGRVVSGASTITMQVAGFAINSRERSLTRKLRQAFTALQLEAHWTKREILESYLTHASYGGNVCGVEAASRRYFNKTAAELSSGEAALLAGIPQSPERFRPDRNLKAASNRRSYVLSRLVEVGDLSVPDYTRIKGIKVETGTFTVPVQAPHYSDLVRRMYPSRRKIQTTLNSDFQHQAERAIANAVTRNRPAGVTNGAVVIIDNKSADVLAMVGSVDYWNRFDNGEVNGALGFRSPGSAMKPLIFGEAMDNGLLEPDEILYDVPVTISGYSPVNFDRRFRGPVPASRALAMSLNIPAIEVMRRVGVAEFQDSLHNNGIPVKVNPVGNQGLSLAIGTCSVRLLDLAMAYSSLASGGKISQPVWTTTHDMDSPKHRQWLSPQVASILLNMLSDDSVRSVEDVDIQLSGLKGVAWKTGTSNGFRDAWTMAVTPSYTVGVWVGNMKGQPSRALVGGQIAAPVALGLAKSIEGNASFKAAKVKNSFIQKYACLQTGVQAGPYCADKVTARFIASSLKSRICQAHQPVDIDVTSGFTVCNRCKGSHAVESKICAHYPSEVTSWLRSTGHPWADELQPGHTPDCKVSIFGDPPVIVSPASDSQIVILEEIPVDFQKITLAARTDDPAALLFWFVDDRFVGTAPSHDSIQILPTTGKHKIRCVDSRGRAAETSFSVEFSESIRKTANRF